jgi:hypothetical protein
MRAEGECLPAAVEGEEIANVVHEQRASRGQTIVVGGMPAQHQQLQWAGDGRVQQVALRRQRLSGIPTHPQAQPRGFREATALLLGEVGLGSGGGREDAFLQATQEQRAYPASA